MGGAPIFARLSFTVARGVGCLLLASGLVAARPQGESDAVLPLIPISEAVADANGDTIPDQIDRRVHVKGVVTVGTGILSDEYLKIAIQDATGGVLVYDRRPSVAPAVGDIVEVEGKLDQYNGAVQISRPRIAVVGKSGDVEPEVLSVAGAAARRQLGRLVRLEGSAGRFPTSGRKLIPLRSSETSINLYFPGRIGRDLSSRQIPEGSRVSVVGIVSMHSTQPPHDAGFQLVVRDLHEIEILALPRPRWWTWVGVGGALLATFASGLAIANPILKRRARRRERALVVMNALSTKISDPTLGEEEVAELSAQTLAGHGLVDAALVHLIGRDQKLRIRAAVGLPSEVVEALDEEEMNRRLWAKALGGELGVPQGSREDAKVLDPIHREGYRLVACLPLEGRSRMVGVLCAFWRRSGDPNSGEREILSSAAKLMALAVENIEMFERSEAAQQELKQLAITDDLTGLYNRRFLEEYCRIQLAIARRQGSSVGFIMIDIDYFKHVNDTYGHDVGDRTLVRVGERIRRVARAGDLPVRYGGEEFIVVMPNTDEAGAMSFAERLRADIEAFDFPELEQAPGIRLTISVGIALFPAHGTQVATVLKACDESLYQAKNLGRNRVVVAEAGAEREA